MKNSNSNHTQPIHNPWGMLLLCYFLGIFGVHKFVEKKTGVGFLYLFTGGLCGVGWLVDCIRYLVAAVSSLKANNQTSADTSPSSSFIKPILLWIAISIAALLALTAFLAGAVLSGFGMAALVAIFLPVNNWQILLSKYIKRNVKIVLAVVFSALFIVGIGTSDSSTPTANPSSVSVSTTTKSTTTNATTTITTTKTTTTTVTTTTTTVTSTTTTTTTTTAVVTTTAHSHNFSDADCDNPRTCKCGATDGDALGHSWDDATCLSPKTCSRCSITSGYALGHSYANGYCSACGAEDPNYTETFYVLNTHTGKFHYSDCSEVNKIEDKNRQDYNGSRDEIESMGYIPCKRCNP